MKTVVFKLILMKFTTLLSCFIAITSLAQTDKLTFENDSIKISIKPLSSQINSEFDDYAPSINADGTELFFTSLRPFTPKEKANNTKSNENIYKATFNLETNKWTEPEPLPENINVLGRFNSNITLSADGQRLLIYQDDKSGNGDIYETSLSGEKWSDPVSISDVINTDAHESSASISPDGRTVYFVSERKGGKGKRDIWQATKFENGTWSTPRNLGSNINTEEDEESVFMHPDGKTLYFSSKGHNSIGGYDVFKSEYINDEWSKPVSLGVPINTKEDDLFFVITAEGNRAYYASSRNGVSKDIYSIDFINKNNKRPKLKILKGVIRDSKLEEPIYAKIEIIDNEKNEVLGSFYSNEETGKYMFTLPSGKNYGIVVTAVNYLFYSDNVTSADTAQYEQIIKDVDLQRIETGTTIVLKNIFFDTDLATLKNESTTELMRLMRLMGSNPKLVLEFSGHTDTRGSEAHNLDLSERRAKAVVDYLISKGIPASRLKHRGYGERQPKISDEEIEKMTSEKEKEAAHAQNRRTEIKIISN